MNYRNALAAFQQRLRPGPVASAPAWNPRAILVALMMPMSMTVLNMSMFGVGVPAIRDDFGLAPDTVAWLVTAYTLPFVLFMPLYGRLGDGLGKRRLFSVGIVFFFAGTLLCMIAPSLGVLLAGRVLQGIGTAGVNPLCIATIAEIFPREERGRALAAWSSTGPATGMIAPSLGGFLVDHFGWHALFWTGLLTASVALVVVRARLPKLMREPQPGFLRRFDWVGMGLLSGAVILLVAYLSSRALTGVEPLRDWRLAAGTLVFGAALIWWEDRCPSPLIPLGLFKAGNFSWGSLAAGLRMVLMSSDGFLLPLFLSDVYGLSGGSLGLVMTFHAVALLATVRWGGRLADVRSRRLPVMLGFGGQAVIYVVLAMLPAETPLWLPALAIAGHGGAAGLSLAVLHRIAMDDVAAGLAGAAAGVYSMVRFFGSVVGATIGGVILSQAAAVFPEVADAYHVTFVCWAAVGLLAIAATWHVRDAARAA